MKLLVYLLLLGFVLFSSKDQIVIRLKGKPEIFTTDNLDNIYVYQNSTLFKYNSYGKLLAQFSSFEYGNIYSMDVSDPFQVLLFYKEFNTILLLDNNLSPVGKSISLDNYNLHSINSICKSRESGVWIIDSYSQKIFLLNINAKKIERIISLQKYTKPLPYFDYIIEAGSDIYLYGKDHTIWTFDQMGGNVGLIDVYTESEFQLRNGFLYFSEKNLFYQYNLENEKTDTIKVTGFDTFDAIRMGEEKMIVCNSDSVTIINLE